MKKFNQYIVILLFSILTIFTSCENWLDVNEDPDSPSEDVITEDVLLPGILVTIVYELAGGFPARFPNMWVGQIANNGTAPDLQTFRILDTDVNNTWEFTLYSNVLKNNKLLMEKASENNNYYYLGISEVVMAYCLAIATDLWGEIPWSQALQLDQYPKPEFDSQEQVYEAIFELLDKAIADLSKPEDGQLNLPGNDDFIYSGIPDLWMKLAYALKGRYNMRLSRVYNSVEQANKVLANLENSFTSNLEDADLYFENSIGAENPWQQWMNKWFDIYIDTNAYTILQKYDDPRLAVFCEVAYEGDHAGEYYPHRNGLETLSAGLTSKIAIERSYIDKAEQSYSFYITSASPVSLITYAELCFLKAEAYLIQGEMDSAQTQMENGIIANFLKLTINNDPVFSETDTAITGFISRIPLLTGFTNTDDALEVLIEQKYIANFLSVENYNDYRRTGFPSLVMPIEAEFEDVPFRMPYPTSSLNYNALNVPKIQINEDRLWWDVD